MKPEERKQNVLDKWGRCNAAKERAIMQMRLNLEYYLGHQYTFLDRVGGNKIYRPSEEDLAAAREKGIILVSNNFIKPISWVICAQFLKKLPYVYCQPRSAKQTAIEKATGYNKVLEWHRTKQSYVTANAKCVKWMNLCGNGYKWSHPCFDKTPHVDLGDGTQAPINDAEVSETVISPFEFSGPPGVKKIEEMPYVFVSKFIDADIVKQRYPNAEFTKSDSGVEMDTYNVDIESGDIYNERRGNLKLLIEYFEKPTRENPDGAHCVYCDTKELFSDKFPYKRMGRDGQMVADGYRIRHYSYDDTLVSHWAQGFPDGVLELQRRYNLLFSQELTKTVLTATSNLLVPDTMKQDDLLKNYPKCVPYDTSVEKPSWLEHNGSNKDLLADMQVMRDAIYEISGVHQVSAGEKPDPRTPAQSLLMQIERDAEKFQPIRDRYEESEALHGQDILNCYKQYAQPTIETILRDEGSDEMMQLVNDSLDDYEVIVEPGSSLPQSRSGQTATVLEMNQYKMWGPNGPDKKTRSALIRAMNLGFMDEILKQEDASYELARKENVMILQRKMPVVLPEQDDELHISVHTEPLDSPESLELQRKHQLAVVEQTSQGIPEDRVVSELTMLQTHISVHRQNLTVKTQPPMPLADPAMQQPVQGGEPLGGQGQNGPGFQGQPGEQGAI